MQYALLFYTGGPDTISATEREKWMARMAKWTEELRAAGVFKTSMRLAPSSASTCVRSGTGGGLLVTDGPFADSKEYVGGFTIIDVADLDAALAWARRCPIAEAGTVEVRPQFT